MDSELVIHIGGDDSAFRQTLGEVTGQTLRALEEIGAGGRDLAGALERALDAAADALPDLAESFAGVFAEGLGSLRGEAAAGGRRAALAAAEGARAPEARREARDAGVYVLSGFAEGLAAKRGDILALCRRIAEEAAAAMSAALEIRSPSRVTMRIGRYAGEGFGIGLRDSLQNAVRTAESVVSNMDLNARVLPDFESAVSGAVNSVYAAESGRPVYLNVNGKTLARVVNDDMRRASNNANRRIGLGVGK